MSHACFVLYRRFALQLNSGPAGGHMRALPLMSPSICTSVHPPPIVSLFALSKSSMTSSSEAALWTVNNPIPSAITQNKNVLIRIAPQLIHDYHQYCPKNANNQR